MYSYDIDSKRLMLPLSIGDYSSMHLLKLKSRTAIEMWSYVERRTRSRYAEAREQLRYCSELDGTTLAYIKRAHDALISGSGDVSPYGFLLPDFMPSEVMTPGGGVCSMSRTRTCPEQVYIDGFGIADVRGPPFAPLVRQESRVPSVTYL